MRCSGPKQHLKTTAPLDKSCSDRQAPFNVKHEVLSARGHLIPAPDQRCSRQAHVGGALEASNHLGDQRVQGRLEGSVELHAIQVVLWYDG